MLLYGVAVVSSKKKWGNVVDLNASFVGPGDLLASAPGRKWSRPAGEAHPKRRVRTEDNDRPGAATDRAAGKISHGGVIMRLSRRQFVRSATGALVFSSTLAVLKRAGIAAEEPIHLGNILDKTGGLNIYSLKQIAAVAMAVDEINAAGGLLGRPVKLYFYDSQSNNQFNSQYATQALVKDKVEVIHGGITSSSREVMRPIVR